MTVSHSVHCDAGAADTGPKPTRLMVEIKPETAAQNAKVFVDGKRGAFGNHQVARVVDVVLGALQRRAEGVVGLQEQVAQGLRERQLVAPPQ